MKLRLAADCERPRLLRTKTSCETRGALRLRTTSSAQRTASMSPITQFGSLVLNSQMLKPGNSILIFCLSVARIHQIYTQMSKIELLNSPKSR